MSKLELPPPHKTARERIDWYLERQRRLNYKPGSVSIPVIIDHKKGYIKLEYEDLKYLAGELGYADFWAKCKAEELGIEIEDFEWYEFSGIE